MTALWRRVLVSVLALAVVAGLVLALIHTPPVRRALLAYAVDLLDDRFGVYVEVEQLTFNLLTLDFRLEGLSVARSDRADAPFLAAESLDVDLPWSVATEGMSFTAIDVTRPTLSLTRAEEGGWNLPANEATGVPTNDERFALPPIHQLTVEGLAVTVRDVDYAIIAGRVDLHLSPSPAERSDSVDLLSGSLELHEPMLVRLGEQETTVDRLRAQVAFDGQNLEIQSLDAQLPEGTVFVEGRALSVLDDPTLELAFDGEVVMAHAGDWWRADHELGGIVVLSGSVSGPLTEPSVTAELVTTDVRWADLSGLRVQGGARFMSGALEVDRLMVTAGEAVLEASGHLSLAGGDGANRVEATWQDVDSVWAIQQLHLELPQIPAGVLSGTAGLTWVEWRPDALSLTTEIRSRALRSSGRQVAVGGRTRLEIRDGRWQAEIDEVTLPGLTFKGDLAGLVPGADAPFATTTLAGSIQIDATDLAELARTFDLPALTGDPTTGGIMGTASAELTLTGSLGAPQAEGRFEGTGIGYQGIEEIGVRSVFSASPRQVDLDQLVARFGPNELGGALGVDLDNRTVDGTLRVSLPDLSAVAPALPTAVAPTGGVEAELTLTGSLTAPEVTGNVEGRDVTVGGRAIDHVVGNLHLDGGVVTIGQLEARQQAGVVTMRGAYTLSDGTYHVDVTGRDLSLGSLVGAPDDSDVRGTLGFEITSAGSLAHPTATGRARLEAIEWAGRAIGAADVDLAVDADRLRLDAVIPNLGATIVAETGLADDAPFNVTADIIETDLGQILSASGSPLDVNGTASLQLAASGRRAAWAESTIRAVLQDLDGNIGTTRVRLVTPGTIEYSAGAVSSERIELRLNETTLIVGGTAGRDPSARLTATLEGDLADLESLLALVASDVGSAPLDLSGAIDTQVVMTGAFDSPVVSTAVHIRNGVVAFGEFPPAHDLVVDLTYDMESVRLEALSTTWQGARLEGEGVLPSLLLTELLPAWLVRTSVSDPTGRMTLTADAITAEAIRPFIDPASLGDLESQAAARLDVEIGDLSLEGIGARLEFGQLELTVGGIPLNQQRPTAFELTDGQIRVTSWAWGSLGNELTLGGTVDLTTPEPTVDMTFTGEGDLRLVGALVDDLSTAGRAFAIINFLGTPSEPVIRGTVEVSDGELRLAEPPFLVSDLTGTVWLEGDRIRTYEMAGNANGGDLEIDGQFQLQGLRPIGMLRFNGRQLAMEVPEGLRTEVDGDIALGVTDDELTLSGTVTILRGDYRQSLALTTGLLSALQQRQDVRVIGQDGPSVLDSVRLNIQVVTDDDIVVSNNYANGNVGVNVRLIGTAGAPAVTGRVSMEEGAEIRLGTNLYEVDTGIVDFVDPAGIQPELNVIANARIASYEITLTLSGSPDTLTTSLQSEPPLPESDIVSVLLTGRTLDQAGSAPGAIARDQALGLVSGELLGTAGRSVGLDTIRIENEVSGSAFTTDSTLVAGETNPGSRLTVGKNLSNEVQLIVSQNLRESGLLTWIVDYLPRRSLELRGVLDDDHNRSYEFRHSISLGDPPRGGESTREGRRRVRRTVASVRFSGTPGFDESELRGLIDLGPNDSYDFREWLRDRDTLEQLYRERGYLEAHVRARRVDVEANEVSLVYEIEQGPRTILEVEGYSLSGSTTGDMRAAWSVSVFDGFLLDELEALARRELISSQFFQPAIETEIVERPEANEKTIRLQIQPGARFAESHLVFRGNLELDGTQLEQYLVARGLETTAWADPEPVILALESLYRSLGFLGATVAVDAPEFEPGHATLPFRIDEGRAYRTASVVLDGITALDPDQVRTATGLVVGDLYTDLTTQRARANVRLLYRSSGFPEARVNIQSIVDQSASTVNVNVEVAEGPRQVVEEVVVAGATRTRPDLVSRALQIEPGQPVDIGAWNQARKRLYDTGAFRSVDIEAQPLEPASSVASGSTQSVRARVLVEEWPLFRIRYGLQLKDEQAPFSESGRDFNLGVVGDVTHQNFLGRAATVGTSFRFDTIQQALRGVVSFRGFFGLPLTSNVFASRRRESIGEGRNAFIDDTTRLTLEQRLRLGTKTTVAYSYNLERKSTELVIPDFQFSEPPFWIARLDASAVVDTRDDIFNATQGWFHSSTIEYAPARLGSDLRFAKYSVQQYYFRNLGPVVTASAVRVGLAGGIGGDFLITDERFFAGGGSTVRGYGQDSLGPFFGGNSLLILNQEVRFPLFWMLGGVGFVDAGNTFDAIRDLSVTDLAVGTGFGVRADTPFGLLRFDVGFPVSKVDDGGPRFYFSIGQAF